MTCRSIWIHDQGLTLSLRIGLDWVCVVERWNLMGIVVGGIFLCCGGFVSINVSWSMVHGPWCFRVGVDFFFFFSLFVG